MTLRPFASVPRDVREWSEWMRLQSIAPLTVGSFTITGTGFSSEPSGTALFERSGNVVVISIPELSGTSNSTAFELTGLPAAITPARLQSVPVPVTRDNGSDFNSSFVTLDTDGTMEVFLAGGIGSVVLWTNGGTKALGVCTITYMLT